MAKSKNTSVLKRLKTNLKQNGLVKSKVANPFEMKVTRQKHQVLGRVVKGAIGKPTVSRKKGQEQRSNTLLKEYKTKDRISDFKDRRFGEGDVSMNVEDKMLERFTKEKMRRSERGAKFNLEDNDDLFDGDDLLGDEKFDLTHSGQKISKLQDSELGRSGNLSQDEDGIDREVVNEHHFGGFDMETEGKKTFKDVMSEVIAKSKHFKQERQKEKAENEDLRLELDDELADVRNVLVQASQSKLQEAEVKPQAEDYDMFVRELAYERKAKPTDRLKTDQEIAQEEAQKLVELEAARLKRMHGEAVQPISLTGADSLDANYQLSEQAYDQQEQDKLQQKRFQLESKPLVYGGGKLLNPEELAFGRAQGNEEDLDSTEESEGEDSESDSLSVLSSAVSVDDPVHQDDNDEEDIYSEKKQEIDELPFTFDAPTQYSDLLQSFSGRSLEQQVQVVERIKTLYHPSLNAENTSRMQVLLKLLLQHLELGLKYKFAEDSTKVPFSALLSLCMEQVQVDAFLSQYKAQIQTLGTKYLLVLAEVFRGRLTTFQKNFVKRLATQQLLVKEHEVLIVESMTKMYSMSDFKHSIGTPLQLLLGYWLSGINQCVCYGLIKSRELLKDNLDVGLKVCRIFLDCQVQAQRYIPEIITFLYSCLSCYSLSEPTGTLLFSEVKEVSKTLIKNDIGLKTSVLELAYEVLEFYAQQIQTITRPGVQQGQADQLEDINLSEVYVKAPCSQGWPWLEVFEQFRPLLDDKNRFYSLRERIRLARKQTCVKMGTDFHRLPMQLHQQKTAQQKALTPKFQERFNPDRFYDPDPQRSQAKKLNTLHKNQLKGAIRELKKDAAFLANTKLQEIKAADSKYNKHIRRVYGMIGNEVGLDKAEAQKSRKQ